MDPGFVVYPSWITLNELLPGMGGPCCMGALLIPANNSDRGDRGLGLWCGTLTHTFTLVHTFIPQKEIVYVPTDLARWKGFLVAPSLSLPPPRCETQPCWGPCLSLVEANYLGGEFGGTRTLGTSKRTQRTQHCTTRGLHKTTSPRPAERPGRRSPRGRGLEATWFASAGRAG